MKKLKMENGITLIALVITIIILLILAVISISAIIGDNGIMSKATEAVIETKYAAVKEAFESALVAVQADYQQKRTTGEVTVSQSEYITIGMIRENLESSYIYCYSYSTEENTFDDDKKLYDISSIYLSETNSSNIIYEIEYTVANDNIANVEINDITDSNLLSEIKIEEDEETTTTTTYDTDDVLLNPGKGFVLSTREYYSTDTSYDDVISVIYYRFNWCVIEPEEGIYNWDVIDEILEDCIERRQKICIWCYVCKFIKYTI